MGDGKFYAIRSRLANLVLTVGTVDGSPVAAGYPVTLQEARGEPRQLWYTDHLLGRIRSASNEDLVLEVDEGRLIVNNYNFDEYNQKWRLAGEFIRHIEDANSVLDVPYKQADYGANVQSYKYKGKTNQQWEYDHAPRRYCFIQSDMHGKVLDINRGNAGAGAEVIMYGRGGGEQSNQLWWEDVNGNIRSKLNDFVFYGDDGENLRMRPFDPENLNGLWAKSGKKIFNKSNTGKVLDIKKGKNNNGAHVTKWGYAGHNNQHWTLVYV